MELGTKPNSVSRIDNHTGIVDNVSKDIQNNIFNSKEVDSTIDNTLSTESMIDGSKVNFPITSIESVLISNNNNNSSSTSKQQNNQVIDSNSPEIALSVSNDIVSLSLEEEEEEKEPVGIFQKQEPTIENKLINTNYSGTESLGQTINSENSFVSYSGLRAKSFEENNLEVDNKLEADSIIDNYTGTVDKVSTNSQKDIVEIKKSNSIIDTIPNTESIFVEDTSHIESLLVDNVITETTTDSFDFDKKFSVYNSSDENPLLRQDSNSQFKPYCIDNASVESFATALENPTKVVSKNNDNNMNKNQQQQQPIKINSYLPLGTTPKRIRDITFCVGIIILTVPGIRSSVFNNISSMIKIFTTKILTPPSPIFLSFTKIQLFLNDEILQEFSKILSRFPISDFELLKNTTLNLSWNLNLNLILNLNWEKYKKWIPLTIVISNNIFQTIYELYPKLKIHQVPWDVKIWWYLSGLIEGFPVFQRFEYLVKTQEEDK